ncbi:hypothetical protein SAMN05443575_1918 [Jatrophihabitans endophyticus]|uniref:Beta-galactosidase n=1 Tax=Jatrophihabitans endophyticus TaxID=1206085 RepID=A0A1M5IJY6_9ACTN|nr:hypothetical protein [Jatrophihabitans endophyticus]SHG28555.1 hypothetical protein SAMN05443575_1918 [Jatrophihabitans endophyticus]
MHRTRRRIPHPLLGVLAVGVTGTLVAGAVTSGADAKGRGYAIGQGVSTSLPSPRAASTTAAPARPTTATSPTATATSPTATSPTATPSASAAAASTPSATATAAATVGKPFLGTLVTHSGTAGQESQAGLKMAMLEVSWRSLLPRQGQVDSGYATGLVKQLKAFQAAGMRVTLGLGLHYTPAWVLALAGSRLVDQTGTVSAQADLVFNQTVRDLAVDYLRALDKIVPFENFWAVRVTSGSGAEMLYPASGTYWAYSAGAQNGPTRPVTMAANPLPGWRPGDSASEAQRRAWADWYLAALDDVADWQMDVATSLGFTGYFQIVTPGQGLRPTQYTKLVAAGLSNGLLGRGAVWSVVYAGLRHRTHVTAYVSSVADGSAGNDVCQASDATVALDSGTAYYFSATRYLARVAAVNGFTVAGETPGYPASASGRAAYADASDSGLLATAYRQASGCRFLGLYWAHDDQVWDGTVPLSRLAQYSSTSAALPALAS